MPDDRLQDETFIPNSRRLPPLNHYICVEGLRRGAELLGRCVYNKTLRPESRLRAWCGPWTGAGPGKVTLVRRGPTEVSAITAALTTVLDLDRDGTEIFTAELDSPRGVRHGD